MRLVPEFVKKHWKPIAVAIAATVVSAFYPPAALKALMGTLASSSVFGVLGAYASAAATAVVAATVGAAVYTAYEFASSALSGVRSLWSSASSRFSRGKSAPDMSAGGQTSSLLTAQPVVTPEPTNARDLTASSRGAAAEKQPLRAPGNSGLLGAKQQPAPIVAPAATAPVADSAPGMK